MTTSSHKHISRRSALGKIQPPSARPSDSSARAMASVFHWSVVLPLLLCLMKVGAENPWKSKTPMSVLIYNDIPGSVVDVECVCHKCHDLSAGWLQHRTSLPWHAALQFEFKMSVLGSTYVWCKMVWGNNWNAFKVWNGPGLWGTQRMPCQQCVVDVKSDGFYQGQEAGVLVWVKPWMQNPPPLVQNSTTNPN